MGLEKEKMQNITIALPEIYLNGIEKLQQVGMVPSRSEAIRQAVHDFLIKEVHTCQLLEFDFDDSVEEQ